MSEMKIMIFQKQVWKAEQNVFSCINIFGSSFKSSLLMSERLVSLQSFFSWTGFQDPQFFLLLLFV